MHNVFNTIKIAKSPSMWGLFTKTVARLATESATEPHELRLLLLPGTMVEGKRLFQKWISLDFCARGVVVEVACPSTSQPTSASVRDSMGSERVPFSAFLLVVSTSLHDTPLLTTFQDPQVNAASCSATNHGGLYSPELLPKQLD